MKRLAVLLTLSLLLPQTACADDASRRAKAAEIITMLNMEKTITQLRDTVMQQVGAMTDSMRGTPLPAERKAASADLQKKVLALMDTQLGWKVMEPEYIKLYADTFTDEELDGIIAFYKSPAGTSLIEKTPELTKQASILVQSKMVILQPQMKQLLEDFVKSQTERLSPSSAPNTSPKSAQP